MGLSFRKSIKIGKNTRINLSKTGGVGISTGVKGARVSVNKKGVRTQVGGNGVYYRKDYSLSNNSSNKTNKTNISYSNNSPTVVNTNSNVILSEDLLKAKKVHVKLTIAMYICLFIGFFIPVFLIVTIGLFLYIFINKNARQRMYVSTAVYNLQAYKLDKARKYLNKAKNTAANELAQQLEDTINNVENVSQDNVLYESDTKDDGITTNEDDVFINLENDAFNKQVERNLKGKEFEKQQDIESAIVLYELNVKENFEGTHPYDRLTIIYRRQKRYDDEIRIINKAIEIFERLYNDCDNEIRKDGYLKTVEKYKNRLIKALELKNKDINRS